MDRPIIHATDNAVNAFICALAATIREIDQHEGAGNDRSPNPPIRELFRLRVENLLAEQRPIPLSEGDRTALRAMLKGLEELLDDPEILRFFP